MSTQPGTAGQAPPNYNQVPVQQQTVQYVQGQQPVQYVQGQSQPQVVYVQQPQPQVIVQNPNHMPMRSTIVQCPKCQKQVQTTVSLQPGLGTWAVAGGICCVGFWCGCCLIPFCIDDLKDAYHSCPACGTHIGVRKVFH